MRIITEPNVHVLSIPQFFPHPEYELPPENSDILKLIAHAGKGCYDSYGQDGRSVKDHIHNLMSTRHGSVLEHVNISLFISGISRGLSHELVRHRFFAYSQRSTRYTNEDEAAIVLDPYYSDLWLKHRADITDTNLFKSEPMRLEQQHSYQDSRYSNLVFFLESCSQSIRHYGVTVNHLMEQAPSDKTKTEKRKWARGKARQLLPHALETRITMTGNIRAWRWFLELRSEKGAEPEIRRLTWFIYLALCQTVSFCFIDFAPAGNLDNIPELKPEISKI